jgi:hypothetical protein
MNKLVICPLCVGSGLIKDENDLHATFRCELCRGNKQVSTIKSYIFDRKKEKFLRKIRRRNYERASTVT